MSAQLAKIESYRHDIAEHAPQPLAAIVTAPPHPLGIREHLRRWQSENGTEQLPKFEESFDNGYQTDISNDLTRLASQDDFRPKTRSDNEDEARMPTLTEGVAEEDGGLRRQYLRRGDLVELGTAESHRDNQLAIFIQEFDRQLQFYTMRGRWIHRAVPHVSYSVRSFVDPAMVEEVLPYLPDHEVTEEELDQAYGFELNVPREAGAKLVERMVDFWRESEAAYRRHASTLDSAHRILAHPSDIRFGHIQRIAHKLIGAHYKSTGGVIPEPTIYAVRKALNRNGFAFSFDKRSHDFTGIFHIRPIQQVEMVEKVQGWLRAYQEDMTRMTAHGTTLGLQDLHPDAQKVQSFVQKAKQLIQISRQTRAATELGNVAPSTIRLPIATNSDSIRARIEKDVVFTEADQSIIRFMEAWASSNLFSRHPRLCALGPVVLRATGQYEEFALDTHAGFMFLQEIGVLLPFENRVKYDEHLLLPNSQHSQVLERLQSRTEQAEIPMEDSMLPWRERWSGPVFAIDASDTLEVDDGVSVERIPESPGEYWIHVHIANPTAFFSRDHALAKIAAHMTETVYMPERKYLMLPSKFSIYKFSLGDQRSALTFSARVNMTGAVVDKKITPRTLDHVLRLTAQDCEEALGGSGAESSDSSITVGGAAPTGRPKRHIHLKNPEIEDLRLLIDLTQARKKRRVKAGALSFHVGEPDFKVYDRLGRPGLGHSPPYRHCPRFIDGDPVIRMQKNPYRFTTSFAGGGNPINDLVEESMLLASEISAAWCKERNIPVIYRGLDRRSESVDPQAFYDSSLRPLVDSGSPLPLHLAFKYLRLHGQVVFNTEPISHRTLGLPHYTRVTSPLRRYGDLIAHWQIEAALREEARSGKALILSSSESDKQSSGCLPFSRTEIDLIIQRLQPRERMIRRAKSLADSFWYSMLVWRAWKYGEAPLPSTFEVLVYRSAGPGTKMSSVLIKEWGSSASMVQSGADGGGGSQEHRDGDWWEARLHSVDVYKRLILLEPLRLLSRGVEG
ncbi:MAG: hypothetical protein M1822_006842 [Bathelium mastoideum]|nr:MAG: hypothetical protein M1822_006842 [Bathelium mastoideum]